MLENIASNAVKAGAAGTPMTLTLQQTATEVSVTIHNDGPPLDPRAQTILFQQFRRTSMAEE